MNRIDGKYQQAHTHEQRPQRRQLCTLMLSDSLGIDYADGVASLEEQTSGGKL